jgi:hypothetical protein
VSLFLTIKPDVLGRERYERVVPVITLEYLKVIFNKLERSNFE